MQHMLLFKRYVPLVFVNLKTLGCIFISVF